MQQLLQAEEYDNVGDLMLQMVMDPEKIREISGIGPKAMEEIEMRLLRNPHLPKWDILIRPG